MNEQRFKNFLRRVHLLDHTGFEEKSHRVVRIQEFDERLEFRQGVPGTKLTPVSPPITICIDCRTIPTKEVCMGATDAFATKAPPENK